MTDRLKQIRERLDAAKNMDTAFAVNDGAPTVAYSMKIAIRTAAFPLIQSAPSDIAMLLDLVEVYEEALEHSIEGLKMWRKYRSPGNVADVAICLSEALARGKKIKGE